MTGTMVMPSSAIGTTQPAPWLRGLLALALLLGGGLAGAVGNKEADEDAAMAALRDMMERAYSGRDIAPPEAPRADGSRGEVEMLGRRFVYDMVDLSREYDRRMAEAGLYRLLLPRRLGADENLRESRAIINQLRATVADYSPQHVALYAELEDRVGDSGLAPALRERLRLSVATGASEREALLERSWRLERMMIERFARLIDTLDNPMTPWREVDGDLRFATSRGAMTYNEHLQRINELGDEQLRLRQQVAESTLESFAAVLER